MARTSSLRERPLYHPPRRLVEWVNPTDAPKVHSLIDKVYHPTNLRMAWQAVRANAGSGGVDRVSWMAFEEALDENLAELHQELRSGRYKPLAVRRVYIPKPGTTKQRPLGIPTIRDRVVQQALLQRLAPIFEPDWDDASFGYRRHRSTKDALAKIWRELQAGAEWVVDADLSDFFGTVDHEKLLTLVNRRIADGRVLGLVRQMLEAGYEEHGQWHPSERGTPQGGVVSPLLSNLLLTPFDREMRRRGYQLTRYADDWVVTCRTRQEAVRVLRAAEKVLTTLGVTLNREKTRIVHVRQGFEFLGYKIKRGERPLHLPAHKITSGAKSYSLYAYPTDKSVQRFRDHVRVLTRRRAPVTMAELVEDLNPVLRGWGEYYKKAHVRKLFHQLDHWIVHRMWSHHYKRWRNVGWKRWPTSRLREELGLVSLIRLIPSLQRSLPRQR